VGAGVANGADGVVAPTVVVAVHDARRDVAACLRSVLACTRGPHSVLVIDDASTDPKLAPYLRSLARRHRHVDVVFHQTNLGYTRTINEGCRRAEGDVVLLNSDTIVTADWLGKLREAAHSRPDVATVTPVSNAAGAFSVPEANVNAELPEGIDPQRAANLVEALSERVRPLVPTGNGFCLYIRRAALDRIGLFDEVAFPRGYGEENDFCMRASAAGFVHLIDDATFVWHRRSASFGAERAALAEQGKRELRRRYPDYKARVKAFLADPALDGLRRRLRDAYDAERVRR